LEVNDPLTAAIFAMLMENTHDRNRLEKEKNKKLQLEIKKYNIKLKCIENRQNLKKSLELRENGLDGVNPHLYSHVQSLYLSIFPDGKQSNKSVVQSSLGLSLVLVNLKEENSILREKIAEYGKEINQKRNYLAELDNSLKERKIHDKNSSSYIVDITQKEEEVYSILNIFHLKIKGFCLCYV
jgi:hypothetical protein